MSAIDYLQKDRILGFGFSGSTFFIVVTLLVALISYQKLPPFIPLFNQLPWGNERLGGKLELFIPIVLSCGILLGNGIGANLLYGKIPLVSRMLCITSLLISVLCFLFVMRTVYLML